MAVVRYIVNDVADSAKFYVDLLGFELRQQFGPNMAILDLGDLTLWIAGPGASASKPGLDGEIPAPGGWSRFVMMVANLDEVVARLTEGDARFRSEIISGPGGRQILLEDPSGNVIELFQPS